MLLDAHTAVSTFPPTFAVAYGASILLKSFSPTARQELIAVFASTDIIPQDRMLL